MFDKIVSQIIRIEKRHLPNNNQKFSRDEFFVACDEYNPIVYTIILFNKIKITYTW